MSDVQTGNGRAEGEVADAAVRAALDDEARDRIRRQARCMLGQDPAEEAVGARAVPGVSASLCLFGAVQDLHLLLLLVLATDVAHSLGTGTTVVNLAVFLQVVLAPLAALVYVRVADRVPRHLGVTVGALATVLLVGLTSLATSGGQILLLSLLVAVAAAPAVALHTPLLVESHPGADRPAVITRYWAARLAGGAAGLLVGGALVAGAGLTWRGVLATAALGGLLAVGLGAAWLPADPGTGWFDERPIRRLLDPTDAPGADDRARLGVFETVRRMLLVPSVKRLVSIAAVLGLFTAPFIVFTVSSLHRDWVLSLGEQLAVAGVVMGTGAVAITWFWFESRDPGLRTLTRFLSFASGAVLVGGLCVLAVPWVELLPMWAFLLGGGAVAVGAGVAALHSATLSLIESRVRPAAASLLFVFSGSVGGLAGMILFGGLDRRFGVEGALLATALPALLVAALLRRASRSVEADVERFVDEAIEQESLRLRRRRGEHIPMLAARGIDFSYGQLQVLFGVDFSVDDGEMVALLGTNGAGKSTLLRVISGLGLPDRGSVHFRGEDITYLDAERRLVRGISQIPGGKAVFPPLSVVDNLRVFGHSLGRDRAAVDRGIAATLEAFPRLDERRNQLAATLSGGEQQMLSLGKAFLLRPQLLLIDELSLGLAPIIVGQLLEMVRRINADGTAIVLVEQSVNVALSLVDHAYFMEKGQIRFDGRAEDLLERRDLLRSVFLEGAAQGQ